MTTDLQINLTICADSLGDNSVGIEWQFARAVKKAIQDEYPLASINVEIDHDTVGGGSIHVTDRSDTNDLEAIREHVSQLQSHVWERVDWWETE